MVTLRLIFLSLDFVWNEKGKVGLNRLQSFPKKIFLTTEFYGMHKYTSTNIIELTKILIKGTSNFRMMLNSKLFVESSRHGFHTGLDKRTQMRAQCLWKSSMCSSASAVRKVTLTVMNMRQLPLSLDSHLFSSSLPLLARVSLD